MKMTDDLVKRMMHLARPASWFEAEAPTKDDLFGAQVYLVEGANRIEALTAERDAADALIDAQAKDHASNNIRFAEATHRADKAEADNTRLRKLLTEAAADLTAYVNAEYPPDTCAEYPHIAKRHHRDMELVRHIEVALNTAKEPSHD